MKQDGIQQLRELVDAWRDCLQRGTYKEEAYLGLGLAAKDLSELVERIEDQEIIALRDALMALNQAIQATGLSIANTSSGEILTAHIVDREFFLGFSSCFPELVAHIRNTRRLEESR